MLQSVLQAVFRLGRRDVDDDPDVHVHLHLHAGAARSAAAEAAAWAGLTRLQLLPPPQWPRLVQAQRVQLELEFRLRPQPVLGLRDKPAQGESSSA